MRRYKLTIEYDGTGLCGWQRQDEGETVQGLVEEAIYRFCGERVTVHCAGRTDAGVHARGQIAHIDLSKDWPEYKVMHAVNFHLLPARVAILKAEHVTEAFHSRFSATGRRYLYRIINRSAPLGIDNGYAWHVTKSLDTDTMREAAQHLIGHYDFSTFRDSQCQAKTAMKTLDELRLEIQGEEILIHAAARSFLHHQVRNMVGSLALVGRGKWSVADFITARDAKDRRAGGPTAPADGLYLMEVTY